MAYVEIQSVSKIYSSNKKDTLAVDDVSLDATDGSITVLVGPSGCGKTTLLRMIAGLEEITTGVIRIDGRVVNEIPAKDRDIAMVFQNYALYPHMTVFDNMAFGLRIGGLPTEEIRKRVNDVAELLQLTGYLDRKPKELSGGQRQRVAVGRAIVRRPKVLLFDEPLSNLDAKLRVEMRMELMRLQKELKWTMIYVTHDQMEAMTMADTMALLSAGKIQQIGSPMTMYDKPVNRFTAEFIGTPPMNFFHGRCESSGDTNFFCYNDQRFELSGSVLPQGPLTLGIRPEHVKLSKSENGGFGMAAKLEFVEHLGNENFYYFAVGNRRVVVRGNVPAGAEDIGTWWFLNFRIEKLHMFDSTSGLRIHN
jgi:ABC-type sugar transport system ATPase subunit